MIDPTDIERAAIQAESAPRRGRKRAAPPPAPANDPDDRPTIRLVTGQLHDAIEQGIAALRADPDLYQRETTLVHVTQVTADEEAGTQGEFREGTPQIHVMSVNTLRERLTRYARWVRFNARAGDWVPAEPPNEVVRGIADRKGWPLRRLTGILEAPSLRPDGSVIDRPGYDAATGFMYVPNCPYPAIPERPTREDARRALAMLEDVFIDFPYATPARAGRPLASGAPVSLDMGSWART